MAKNEYQISNKGIQGIFKNGNVSTVTRILLLDDQKAFLKKVLEIYDVERRNVDKSTIYLPNYRQRVKYILENGWYYVHEATGFPVGGLIDPDKIILNKIRNSYIAYKKDIDDMMLNR